MPITLVVTLVAVFATVALVSGSMVSLALARSSPERKRLRNLTTPRKTPDRVETLQLAEGPSPALRRLWSLLPASPTDLSRLRRRLAAAGYRDDSAAIWYSIARLATPVAFGAVPLFVIGVRSGWIVALACAAVGLHDP